MSSITQKVLIDLETSKATEEMKKLAKAGGNTADTIKALNARAKELETSLGQIKAAAPTSTFTAFKGAMKGVGDLMQPFNQGLELSKKLLGVAEEGLTAYAKTSRQAAADVRALTSEFAAYKKGVMEGIGAAAVQLGKAAVNYELALEALRRGGEKGFGKAYGDINKQWNAINDTIFDSVRAFDSLGISLQNTFGDVTQNVAKNAADAINSAAVAARKAAEETARWRAEFLAFQQQNTQGRNYLDVTKAAPGGPLSFGGLGSSVSTSQLDLSGLQQGGMSADALDRFNEEQSRASRYAASARNRNESFLASTFGPIDDFNAYATAFGTLNTAVQSAMSAWISGSMSLGAAIKKGIGDALAGLASQMAVEALKHGAYALGSYAFGDIRGATAHAGAAAQFGAAAVAAAVAAKKLGGGGGATASASAGGGGASAGGGGGASFGNSSSSQGQGERTIVYIGDPFANNSPRMIETNIRRAVDQAYGSQGTANR